jgi:hypothetical protein
MKNFAFVLAFIFVASAAVFADVRLPDTPKPADNPNKTISSRMIIRLSPEATETKLIIPKNQVKQLRAALEELDNESGSELAVTDSGKSFSRSQTIVSGLFMSLAVVFGGVWFARSRKTDSKTSKKIVAGAVLFFIGSMATLVYANVGPPPALRTIDANLFDKKVFGGWKAASGNVKIEISNTATTVELIVPDKEKKETAAGE